MATVVICDRCKKEIKENNKKVVIRVSSEAVNKLNTQVEICDKCYGDIAFYFQKGGAK